MQRFTTKLIAQTDNPAPNVFCHKEAWMVIDSAAKHYNMPENACAVHMSKENADVVCAILNAEWIDFIKLPW